METKMNIAYACTYVNMYVHTETYILCILLKEYKIRKLVKKGKAKTFIFRYYSRSATIILQ